MTAIILSALLALGAVHSTVSPAWVARTPTADRGLTTPVGGIRDVSQGREGVISHMGAGYPANYLAIPIGPGHRVVVCGPARCLTLTSTDAGPASSMLRAGRIADVSRELFAKLCCSPSRGLFRGSWRLAGAAPTLPPTDTTETP